MDLNKVMLIGNITKDIQMRTTQGGQNVASFSVATNRRWKDPSTGDFKDDAQFHNVVAWGKLAEICNQYMGKGRKIYVEGRLQTRTWDDPQSGQKKYFTEIIAENIIMLDSKGVRNSSGNYEEGGEQSQQTSRPASADISNSDTNIPATEEIPTINVDEDQEEIKVRDIPF